MVLRMTAAALAVGLVGLVPSTAAAATTPQHVVAYHHACTRTSTGTCIRGGEFCPQKKYHHSGWDAKGRRYVCKGDADHPHWEKP